MSLLTSLAIILLSALLLGGVFRKIKLPPIVGMLLVGIVLGPHMFDLVSPDLIAISSDLRQLALIIILTRAGLSLKLADLKKVGRPALLLCFVPATFEIVGYMLLAPLMLGLTPTESALTGAVMGAVSPAVVVPRMLRLQKEGYGTNKSIPQMIIAGSSCDDVFVIVLFTALLTTVKAGGFDYDILWQIPVSIVLGISAGVLCGWLLSMLFNRIHVRDTIKIIVLLSLSFLFVTLEDVIKNYVPFSGLLAVISSGVMLNINAAKLAERLAVRYEKLWVFAEIILFVLVGTEVDLSYVAHGGGSVVAVLLCALVFRVVGVFACLVKTPLCFRERVFCAIAYIPKATVQAAIGAIPLAAGLSCGQTVLTCAVMAILITAPLGALATDLSYKRLLTPSTPE